MPTTTQTGPWLVFSTDREDIADPRIVTDPEELADRKRICRRCTDGEWEVIAIPLIECLAAPRMLAALRALVHSRAIGETELDLAVDQLVCAAIRDAEGTA